MISLSITVVIYLIQIYYTNPDQRMFKRTTDAPEVARLSYQLTLAQNCYNADMCVHMI